MFEYTEEGANSVVAGIESNISAMEQEAAEMSAEAEADIAEAEACEAEAQECLAKAESAASSCPHYKTEWKTKIVTNTVPNGDGTYREESSEEQYPVQVIDSGADAAAMAEAEAATARAAECQVKATGLRASAAALRVLSSALSGAASALRSTLSAVKGAIELAEVAIGKVEAEIKETISNISKVLSIFDVPEANNFQEWIIGVKRNIFVTTAIEANFGVSAGITASSWEETKAILIASYTEYLKDKNLTEEERKQLELAFIDRLENRTIILSSEDMVKYFGDSRIRGVYDPYNDVAYVVDNGTEWNVSVCMHEVGCHAIGNAFGSNANVVLKYYDSETKEMQYYDDSKAGMDIIVVGAYDNTSHYEEGLDETYTEYFTRKMIGVADETCAYTYSVDLTESIVESFANHNIGDMEQAMFDSYTQKDPEAAEELYEKVMGESGYQDYGWLTYELNNCSNVFEYLVLQEEKEELAAEVEQKCAEYEQAHLGS